jgi:hypothetical protein
LETPSRPLRSWPSALRARCTLNDGPPAYQSARSIAPSYGYYGLFVLGCFLRSYFSAPGLVSPCLCRPGFSSPLLFELLQISVLFRMLPSGFGTFSGCPLQAFLSRYPGLVKVTYFSNLLARFCFLSLNCFYDTFASFTSPNHLILRLA